RLQAHGLLNADGWGVGLWVDGRGRRWRGGNPLWQDESFAEIAPILRSHCIVAAVRSATPNLPIGPSASAPFRAGNWLISHNGVVSWEVLARVRAQTAAPYRHQPESQCDSALLVALIFDRGLPLLGDTLSRILKLEPLARLNLLLADGHRLLATTCGDTLFYRRLPAGMVLASEPYDDDDHWQDIADGQLVEVNRAADGSVRIATHPLADLPEDVLGAERAPQ
ncbi:MAG: hypothetical protein ACRC0L_07730, partial [Angustibacter sp.]